MKENYKPIQSMKDVPDHLRKLRREFIHYQQAELIYSLLRLITRNKEKLLSTMTEEQKYLFSRYRCRWHLQSTAHPWYSPLLLCSD